MAIIINDEKRDEIIAECEQRGASENNVAVQFSRYFKFPEKVAAVIVSQRKSYKGEWRGKATADEYDILASESNYLKYMRDNVILLEVLLKRFPDSDLTKGWEKAVEILEGDLAK